LTSFFHDEVTKKWYDDKENLDPADRKISGEVRQPEILEIDEDIEELQRLLPNGPPPAIRTSERKLLLSDRPAIPVSPPPAIPIPEARPI